MTEVMNTFERGLSGQCRRNAPVERNTAVERRCEFKMDERPLLLVPTNEFLILSFSLRDQNARDDIDTCFAESFEAFPRDDWIRIFDRADNALYARLDQCPRARRRSAMMMMRLERNICGSAARLFTCLRQSDLLRMEDILVKVCALTDDLARS